MLFAAFAFFRVIRVPTSFGDSCSSFQSLVSGEVERPPLLYLRGAVVRHPSFVLIGRAVRFCGIICPFFHNHRSTSL